MSMLSSWSQGLALPTGEKTTLSELNKALRITARQNADGRWFAILDNGGTGWPVRAELGRAIVHSQRPLSDAEKVGLTNRRVYNASLVFMAEGIASGRYVIHARDLRSRQEAISQALTRGNAYVAMDGRNRWAVYSIATPAPSLSADAMSERTDQAPGVDPAAESAPPALAA